MSCSISFNLQAGRGGQSRSDIVEECHRQVLILLYATKARTAPAPTMRTCPAQSAGTRHRHGALTRPFRSPHPQILPRLLAAAASQPGGSTPGGSGSALDKELVWAWQSQQARCHLLCGPRCPLGPARLCLPAIQVCSGGASPSQTSVSAPQAVCARVRFLFAPRKDSDKTGMHLGRTLRAETRCFCGVLRRRC